MTVPTTRALLDVQALDARELPTVGLFNFGSILKCAPAVHVGNDCSDGDKGGKGGKPDLGIDLKCLFKAIDLKCDVKADLKCDPKPDPKCDPKPDPKCDPKPEPKCEVKPAPKPEPKCEVKPAPKPTPVCETPSKPTKPDDCKDGKGGKDDDDGKCDLFHGWKPDCEQGTGSHGGGKQGSGKHEKSGKLCDQKSGKFDDQKSGKHGLPGKDDGKGKDDCGIKDVKSHARSVVSALLGKC